MGHDMWVTATSGAESRADAAEEFRLTASCQPNVPGGDLSPAHLTVGRLIALTGAMTAIVQRLSWGLHLRTPFGVTAVLSQLRVYVRQLLCGLLGHDMLRHF